jgi:radical SAM protein with 4Fe4S-binding SPASM domain
MDGTKEVHDYQRPSQNGQGSFDVVYKTAQYFYEHNFKFAFRSTISKFALTRMNECIDFFNEEFPGISIAMERMSEFGRTFDSGIEAPSLSEFKTALKLAHEHAYSVGAILKNASLGKTNSLRTVFCQSVAVPNWTILSDGRITSCTRDSFPEVFTFGQYNAETKRIEFDSQKLSMLKSMNVFNFEECTDCFAKYNCAGDCPNLRVAKLVDCDANRDLLLQRFLHIVKNEGREI